MHTDDLVRELEDLAGPEPETSDAWLSTMRRARKRRTARVVTSLAVVAAVVGGVAYAADLGSSGGSTTSVSSGGPARTSGKFFKATTTLIVDLSHPSDEPSSGFHNISQVALFVTKGDVPDAVAAKVGDGETSGQLARRITTRTDRRTSTIAITAVAPSARRAEQLADAFTAELVTVLDQKSQDSMLRARDQMQQRLDQLNTAINALFPQIAANPPNVDQLKAQQSALSSQYTTVYDSLTRLTTQAPATSRFTTLEKAHAVRIDKDEYEARRHER